MADMWYNITEPAIARGPARVLCYNRVRWGRVGRGYMLEYGRGPLSQKGRVRYGREPLSQTGRLGYGREPLSQTDSRLWYGREPLSQTDRLRYGREPLSQTDRLRYGREPLSQTDRLRYGREPLSQTDRLRYGREPLSQTVTGRHLFVGVLVGEVSNMRSTRCSLRPCYTASFMRCVCVCVCVCGENPCHRRGGCG